MVCKALVTSLATFPTLPSALLPVCYIGLLSQTHQGHYYLRAFALPTHIQNKKSICMEDNFKKREIIFGENKLNFKSFFSNYLVFNMV